ncbi:MAG: deoxyribodipyrimidine photo-lyase [Pseudomonadales bacterium]
MHNLVWLRNDLRISDNPALHAACQRGEVTCVFLVDNTQWQNHDMSPWRIAMTLRSVDCVSQQLAELGIELLIQHCDGFTNAAKHIVACAQQVQAQCVFFNAEIALNEQRRDNNVEDALKQNGIACERHQSFTHLPPGAVTKPDGGGYTVFTPFKKRWLAHPLANPAKPLAPPKPQGAAVTPQQTPDVLGQVQKDFGATLWQAGEVAAQRCLSDFVEQRATAYDQQRDLPLQPGTSQLSPHLAIGTISPGQCLHAAYNANNSCLAAGNPGLDTWISELIWREFYNHILAAHPRLSMGQAFHRETELLEWNHNDEWLARWQAGETGLPLVDAGMRQLNSTGWMHNRLRMVTSQFLAKHLFINWREGERYFMQNLVDGDLAANNGGWQWSASTGTDAVPYFRMFNPIRQAERFDPTGAFVRSQIPELAHTQGKSIFTPWQYTENSGYPKPVVDLAQARDATLAAWKRIRNNN